MSLKKIVSGGQTGVDRGALDAALSINFPCGGWCPKGRHAEDGPIDDGYPLKEAPSSDYKERTYLNARDSDGTLIICHGSPSGGTGLTIRYAEELNKPYFIYDLDSSCQLSKLTNWLKENQIETLNVAGPRASKAPGISELTFRLISQLLK